MSVDRTYTEDVELSTDWDWPFVHDLEDLLNARGFVVSYLQWEKEGNEAKAESSRDLASEFPDPKDHHHLLLSMSDKDSGTRVAFSSRTKYVTGTVSFSALTYATVSGADEAEVLGLAAVLRRFADNYKYPADGAPSDPVWKQPWFWGAMTVLVAVITLAVIIIVS